ncbi:unnamed protein product, partial [Staurois parvus]
SVLAIPKTWSQDWRFHPSQIFEISRLQIPKQTMNEKTKKPVSSALHQSSGDPQPAWLRFQEPCTRTPVQSVSWPFPKPGPRIGDFIPPRSL